MRSAAAAALADVQTRIAACKDVAEWTETLRTALDLLQTPHDLDGAHVGSTLSFGIDALRAWAEQAKHAVPSLRDASALWNDDLWDVVAHRVHAALETMSPAAANRLGTVVDHLLHVWDTAGTRPPRWAHTLQHAGDGGRVSSLIVQDVLLAHYGIDVLDQAPLDWFVRLLDDVRGGRGQVRRRTHLALTFVRVVPAGVRWLDTLATSLAQADERASEYLVAHVVQPLLEHTPSLLPKLVDALDSCGNARAVLAVLLVAKRRGLCTIEAPADGRVSVPRRVLETCLASASPRLHVAALALCVEAASPARPLEPAEAHGVRRFLATSLSLPSAVARQDTLAYLVKLLVRLRTSAKNGSSDELEKDVYASAVQAIHPGAPYARTVLGVSLLLVLVEASARTRAPEAVYADSALQEAVRALHKAQQTFPAAPLAMPHPTMPVVQRLMHLAAESTYDDIRSTAALVLVRLAEDDACMLHDPAFLIPHVVQPSVERLGASKEAEAHAAVQLLRLYHRVAPPSCHAAILACVAPTPVPPTGDWTADLLTAHLARVQAQLDASPSLVLASHAGVHGALAALTYLAGAAPHVDREPLRALVERVWALVAPVLCAAAPEGADDVSEWERALAATHSAPDDVDAKALPGPQRVLSFAWRAIKEAAALHTVYAKSAPPDALAAANELFQTWLLQIRHRGAFSTVYPEYHALARALVAAPTTSALPGTWLHTLLDRVDAHAEGFSTTRRSAGLGYAVLALLSAQPPAARTAATERVVARLVRMGRNAAPMRCIHGLNMLRVLVMDSIMASAMRLHLGDALSLAVTSFSSTHWSVRNAATMLFAAISTRHFGVRAFQGAAHHGPWLDPLLEASPSLRPALLDTLVASAAHVGAADLAELGHGSALYAVLLLLSRTQPQAWPNVDVLLAPLEQCTHSANAAVRDLAATCVARLVPVDQRDAWVERLLREATPRDQNALAGTLAVVHALASPVYAPAVRARADLLQGHACPFTLAAYIQVAEACGALDAVRPFVVRLLHEWDAQRERDPFLVWLLPPVLAAAWAQRLPVPRTLLRSDADMQTALVQFLDRAPSLEAALAAVEWPLPSTHDDLVALVLDAASPLDARQIAARLVQRLACPLDAQADALLALLLATEHRGLSEALVPLVGRVCTPDRYDACVRIWDVCSQPEASVAARLGVAQSLETVPCTDARLVVILLRLLQDDDAHVREAACALCPAPSPTPGTGYASVDALPRGPPACVEWVWRTAKGPAFHAHVWRLLTPVPPAQRGAEALFSSEAANQYEDAALDVLRAYDACQQGHVPLPPDLAARAAAVQLTGPVPTAPGAYLAALQEALLVRLAEQAGVGEARPDVNERLEALVVSLPPPPLASESPPVPPLRVALISDFFFPNVGGVEGHMYMVGQELLRRGHKVIVVTHAYEPDRAGVRYLPGGMKVYYVSYGVLVRQDTLPNYFALMPVLRSILVRERIELVHAHQALSSMAHEGLFHAKCLGIKTVFTDHSLFGFADVSSILTNKLLRFALADVDHVVCVSHTGRENTVLRAALDPCDVSTIPNAVDARHLYPQSEPVPVGEDVCIVVLSRLMYRKGIDLLLQTIPTLCARDAHLRFVIGGDGPKYVEIEQMREQYLLQDRVELVGAVRQREVRAHLTRGHIFLNTSLTEAFGTSIIEATCAGLYVVTTCVGGIPELLPPSMMRLAEPRADALVEATLEALAHVRAKRHDPAQQHRRVAGMYAWSDTAARLERVYAQVLSRPSRTAAERLRRYKAVGGPLGGPLICMVVALQMMLAAVLEWLLPRDQIECVD
ncbi:phosphatidylinositol N-acetylglucosaminyltransferase [Malassezia nana]|uniref:Phosphatidylinositol N-acetylglucosaminyltransferase GPI3 subunit n=1 Tax=Malassezia nana TaxID=180528 RepID=A0AAF0EQS7_9BASI|nr:phosphatidylinositol N-acetylglucosaminyltransferase [Malassezia nana]